MIGSSMANSLQSRLHVPGREPDRRGGVFPFVDILDGSDVRTRRSDPNRSPLTTSCATARSSSRTTSPSSATRHSLTFGAYVEKFDAENVFSELLRAERLRVQLAGRLLRDANGSLANPNRTTSPVTLRRFKVRWMQYPGLDKALQNLNVWYGAGYAQDEWRAASNLTVTGGAAARCLAASRTPRSAIRTPTR